MIELLNLKGEEYSETMEQEHILEQYKLYIESAERVSDRRNNVNKFCLGLTTSILGLLSYIKTSNSNDNKYLVLVLSISAILICIYWLILLENYRKLNSIKFEIIHNIERLLPLKLFDFEWEKLGKGYNRNIYILI